MKKSYLLIFVFFICLFILIGYGFSGIILSKIGSYLIVDEIPQHSDAVIVLNTGVEYFPRIIEAARLYKNGFAETIVINGNRKTDVLRKLEEQGFTPCCSWDEDRKRILDVFGVPRKDVISISAEDAYDTITEAEIVGKQLIGRGVKHVIVTTSKFHTRRAKLVWTNLYGDRLKIFAVSAKTDSFDPKGWWKEGRQIRWVLAEYGAWIYYWLRK